MNLKKIEWQAKERYVAKMRKELEESGLLEHEQGREIIEAAILKGISALTWAFGQNEQVDCDEFCQKKDIPLLGP